MPPTENGQIGNVGSREFSPVQAPVIFGLGLTRRLAPESLTVARVSPPQNGANVRTRAGGFKKEATV